MSNEVIAQLRAELANLEGPVRVPALVRLGQALMAESYRIGPGNPAAKPDLDASIDALNEAYGYLDAGDAVRGHVAGLLGFQLAARYGAYGGAERDRETGIHVLEEALSFAGLPAGLRGMTQISLGQLYLLRATGYLQTGTLSFQARSEGTASAEALADADRARACVQPLIEGDPVADELTTAARTVLEFIEAVRAMIGAMDGDLAGFDLGRLTGAAAKLQELWERMRQHGPAGYRMPAADLLPLGFETLASLDPLDRPVAVVQGKRPEGETAPPVERAAPPPPPDPAELRRSLYALLPAMSGGGEDAVWRSAAELLAPEAPVPDAATVDELVALASTIIESAPRPVPASGPDGAGGSDQAAIDAYLLAVALLLRHRADPGSDGADRRSGAEELLSAARTIPLDHPAAMVILCSLGAFLSETQPLDGVVAVIGGRYADRLDIAIAAGVAEPADLVTLHALRCLCRAAEALAELRRAAGTVPTEYPWLAAMKAAGELAESATA